jgi:hypothetical protein
VASRYATTGLAARGKTVAYVDDSERRAKIAALRKPRLESRGIWNLVRPEIENGLPLAT